MKPKQSHRTKKIIRRLTFIVMAAVLPLYMFWSWGGGQPAQVAFAQAGSKPAFSAVSKGRVDVEGGLVHLAAKRDGVVEKVLVKEGDLVRSGQTLAVLDDQMHQLALQVTQKELAQVEASQGVIQRQIEIAAEEEKRFRSVYATGGVAELKYLRYKNRLDVLRAKLKEARAHAETSRSRIKQAAYELERSMVLAPADGMIVHRKVRPGDGVSTLNVTPLFVFAPRLPLIVRAELDERFRQKVRSGDLAQVTPEADDSHSYQARVLRVGKVFGQQHLASDDPSQRQDVRVLEVELGFSQKPDLLIGQRVLVHYLKDAPDSIAEPNQKPDRLPRRISPLGPSPGFRSDSSRPVGPGGA